MRPEFFRWLGVASSAVRTGDQILLSAPFFTPPRFPCPLRGGST
jgi:hypothetical protein